MPKKLLVSVLAGLCLLFTLSLSAYAGGTNPEQPTAQNPFSVGITGGVAWGIANDWKRVDNNLEKNAATDHPINQPDHTTRIMPIAGINFGYHFANSPIRIALAYYFIGVAHYHWSQLLSQPDAWRQVGNIHLFSNVMLFNLYYNFPHIGQIIPFIMGGAGFAINSAKFNYTTHDNRDPNSNGVTFRSRRKNTMNFAWTVGLGAAYQINPQLFLSALVSYMWLGQVNANYNLNGVNYPYMKLKHLQVIAALLSLSYHFGG